tara:strand:+ start:641 stop:856 length:216 start_codon:yes stop_codon:yes gene_type:complete
VQTIYLHDIEEIECHDNSIPADPDGSHKKYTSTHINFTDDNNNLTSLTFYQEGEPKYKVIVKEIKIKKDKK